MISTKMILRICPTGYIPVGAVSTILVVLLRASLAGLRSLSGGAMLPAVAGSAHTHTQNNIGIGVRNMTRSSKLHSKSVKEI